MREKDRLANFRITEAMHKMIKERARAAGISVSEFMRRLIVQEMAK